MCKCTSAVRNFSSKQRQKKSNKKQNEPSPIHCDSLIQAKQEQSKTKLINTFKLYSTSSITMRIIALFATLALASAAGVRSKDDSTPDLAETTKHRKLSSTQTKAEVFHMFDRDGDGYISQDEMRLVINALGSPASQAEVSAMMGAHDVDNDGKLTFQEFAAWLASVGAR